MPAVSAGPPSGKWPVVWCAVELFPVSYVQLARIVSDNKDSAIL